MGNAGHYTLLPDSVSFHSTLKIQRSWRGGTPYLNHLSWDIPRYSWSFKLLLTGTLCSCPAVNTPGTVESILQNTFWEMLTLISTLETLPHLSRVTSCLGLPGTEGHSGLLDFQCWSRGQTRWVGYPSYLFTVPLTNYLIFFRWA